MPESWVVYPPVDIAPKAWQMLSKSVIGPAHRRSMRTTVSAI